MNSPETPLIECRNVWKVFGARSAEAIAAVREKGLSKREILGQFNCVVGVHDASFTVSKGGDFLHHGLVGQWQIHADPPVESAD
jgi:glycine betaine/proline transport system ATP-binding protein